MIRIATKEDTANVNNIRKQVNDLHVQGEPEIFKSGFAPEMAEYINEFVNSNTKYLIINEDDNGTINAYAMVEFIVRPENVYRYELKYLEIHEFGVDKTCRHQGIGTKLINYIKNFALQKGFNHVELDAWAFNAKAINFYKKMGFEDYRHYFRLYL